MIKFAKHLVTGEWMSKDHRQYADIDGFNAYAFTGAVVFAVAWLASGASLIA